MIVRIVVENLVLVERAEFEPAAGLTAVTGETGAGKTLLTSAIGLLFGADADAAQVGPFADQTWVEGEFEVPAGFWDDPSVAALAELRPEDDAPLVLARRIAREGRSRALAWGRAVTKGDLAAAGRLLLATAGQHSQRQLLAPSAQRRTLDAAAGAEHRQLVEAMAAAWQQLQQAREDERALHERVERSRAEAEQRRLDLEAIEALAPSIDDERELLAQRDRARHRGELLAAASTSVAALDGDGSGGGAVDLLGQAWAQVERAAALDARLAPVAATLLDAQHLATDCASTLRSHAEDLAAEGAVSIDEIEQRLSAYDELKRRFGGTTEAVLARWRQLAEAQELAGSGEQALAAAQARVREALQQATDRAAELTAGRREAAQRLAGEIRDHLATLGMGGSVFAIAVEPAELGRTGGDAVEFRLAPSERIEPRPVAQVASGGELSRLALALHVAGGTSDAPTIVFDEIDAGVGGHTAHAIGALLRQLGEHTQVLCVTHLPQVAARADAHVVVRRRPERTELAHLSTDELVLDELCRMLGADADDPAAREHAAALRGPVVGARRARAARGASAVSQQSFPIP